MPIFILFYFIFSPETLTRLFLLKEDKPSPNCKKITLVNLFPPTAIFSLKPICSSTLTTTTPFPAKTTLVHERTLLSLERIRSNDSLLLHDIT